MSVQRTHFPRLKEFWDVEESFPIQNREQFRNSFIGALSVLSDELLWQAALKTAREEVLRNIRAKKTHASANANEGHD